MLEIESKDDKSVINKTEYIGLVNAKVWCNKVVEILEGQKVNVPKDFAESLKIINYIK